MPLVDSTLSPIPMLLAQSELLLTDEQKAELGRINLDLRASLVAIMAERTLIEIEAERESLTSPSGSGLTETTLSAIDGKTTGLRRAWLEARNRARGVLSAEQISKLKEFADQPPAFISGPPVPQDTDLHIAEVIDRRLKDTKVIEIETAQAIAERLFGWTKVFAIFTAVPLAVLGVILGVLGVKSYTDLMGKIEDANTRVTERIKSEEARVKEFDDRFTDLGRKYAALEGRYANTATLASRVDNLDNRVRGLESIEACKDKPLPSDIQNSVNQEISDYRNYLVTLGYTPLQGTVTVCSAGSAEAYYDGKSLVINPSLATDSFTVAHEYTHHMVQTMNPAYWNCGSLQCLGILYGFAEYLPASYLGQSHVGQKFVQLYGQGMPETIVKRGYLWSLDSNQLFAKPTDETMEPHTAGEAWAGAFWEIRTIFGCHPDAARCEDVDRALLGALNSVSLSPVETLGSRLATTVTEKVVQSGRIDQSQVAAVFGRRGLKL